MYNKKKVISFRHFDNWTNRMLMLNSIKRKKGSSGILNIIHSFNYIFVIGQHPMVKGETVRATVCFGHHTFAIDTYKSQCQLSKEVLIGNCGDFFIFIIYLKLIPLVYDIFLPQKVFEIHFKILLNHYCIFLKAIQFMK